MAKILDKVIQKQELFTKKDALLVGVSGGVDSMVLCHILYEEGYLFNLAHCNYHLRGNESNLDEQLIQDWANERGIRLFIKSCPLITKKNIQETARNLRYDFFNQILTTEKFKYIVTAHHENDLIETFFINLSRGSGINGLQAFNKINNNVIRPLLDWSKKEISDYAIQNQVPFREDRSNQDNDYLRNFFRNEIIPAINLRVPAFHTMTLRTIAHLSELKLFVDAAFKDWKNDNVVFEFNGIKITKNPLEKFYMLSMFLIDLGFHPETILRIKMNYNKVGKRFTDKNRHELLVDRNCIFIRMLAANDETKEYQIEKENGQEMLLNGLFQWGVKNKNEDIIPLPDSNFEVLFDMKALHFPLLLRVWRPGDVIKPLGMNGKTKKIQDVLTDKMIPIFEKEKIYIVISDGEVLWIPGIIRSEVARIENQTQSYFHISWIKTNLIT